MILAFSEEAWEDYLFWQSKDRKIQNRINKLLEDIKRDTFAGVGNPELLKFDLSGYWSRRINVEHRLVYKVLDGEIFVISCRYHY